MADALLPYADENTLLITLCTIIIVLMYFAKFSEKVQLSFKEFIVNL